MDLNVTHLSPGQSQDPRHALKDRKGKQLGEMSFSSQLIVKHPLSHTDIKHPLSHIDKERNTYADIHTGTAVEQMI